jgi:hypothetical protein
MLACQVRAPQLVHPIGTEIRHDLTALDAHADPAQDWPKTIVLRHIEELDHGAIF